MPGTPTPRYGLATMAGTDQISTADNTHNSAMGTIDGIMSTAYSGTLAARPAAGKLGRYYYATDRGMLYLDTGVSWVSLLPEIGSIEWVARRQYTSGYKDGWVVALGGTISRTTYPLYWSLVGDAHGPGNGTTTVDLPNAIGRMPIGAGGAYAAGDKGGNAQTQLATTNLPPHGHGIKAGSGANAGSGVWSVAYSSDNPPANQVVYGTDETGSGLPFSNLPPYIGAVPIVRVA